MEAGSHITTVSLSLGENSAQTPHLQHVAPLSLGCASQDPTPECNKGGSAFTCSLGASLTEVAGLSTRQEGVKGQLDPHRALQLIARVDLQGLKEGVGAVLLPLPKMVRKGECFVRLCGVGGSSVFDQTFPWLFPC